MVIFKHLSFRYPKPGRTNPFVSVYVADLRPSSDGRPNLLVPPTYFDDKERIIYAVTWANNKDVSLTWENRHQNYSLVSVCDTSGRIPSCKDSLVMTEPNGWLELDQPPVFTEDGKRFAMILPAEGIVLQKFFFKKKRILKSTIDYEIYPTKKYFLF